MKKTNLPLGTRSACAMIVLCLLFTICSKLAEKDNAAGASLPDTRSTISNLTIASTTPGKQGHSPVAGSSVVLPGTDNI